MLQWNSSGNCLESCTRKERILEQSTQHSLQTTLMQPSNLLLHTFALPQLFLFGNGSSIDWATVVLSILISEQIMSSAQKQFGAGNPSLPHSLTASSTRRAARRHGRRRKRSQPAARRRQPLPHLSPSPYAKSTPKLASNLRLDPSRSCRPHILHLLTTRKKTKKTPEYTSGRTVEACHTRGQKTRRKKKDFLSNGKHFFQKKEKIEGLDLGVKDVGGWTGGSGSA